MMSDQIHITAMRASFFMFNGVRLVLDRYNTVERQGYAARITWEPRNLGTILPDDLGLNLTTEAAQELMDSLWSCGLRPTDGAGSAGAMTCAQENLKDLRGVLDKVLASALRKVEVTR